MQIPVRRFDTRRILDALQHLIERGARRFKFVDRTFNIDRVQSENILQFLKERAELDLFTHIEMVPDNLPTALRTQLSAFPVHSIQIELGVQTLNPVVAQRINRRQDAERLLENLRFLRENTHAHLHTDLIAGLPGENLESFAAGFDRLVRVNPQEIQVGFLKRLRGTRIVRHEAPFSMVFEKSAPYEVLETADIDFLTMQRLKRFARFWNLVVNSGNFTTTAPAIWSATTFPREPADSTSEALEESGSARIPAMARPKYAKKHSEVEALHRAGSGRIGPIPSKPEPSSAKISGSIEGGAAASFPMASDGVERSSSPFHAFWTFSGWLFDRLDRVHDISLDRLAEQLFLYLTQEHAFASWAVCASVLADYQRCGRRPPRFLLKYGGAERKGAPAARQAAKMPKRQSRHP